MRYSGNGSITSSAPPAPSTRLVLVPLTRLSLSRDSWRSGNDTGTSSRSTPTREYRRAASRIVERAREGDTTVIPCERSDGALLYFDFQTGEMVIVKDGAIETMFKPGFQPGLPYDPAIGIGYFLDECRK
jgi:hypothetical protein